MLGTDSGSTVVESNDIPKFNGIIDSALDIISGVAPVYDGIYFSVLDHTFVAKLGTDYYASWDTSHLYKSGSNIIESRLFEYNKQLYMLDGETLNLLSDMTKMAGYTYISTATPSTTPVTLKGDEKVFYIATEEGDYSKFGVGNISELSVIKSENVSWVVEALGVNNYMEIRENAHGDLFFADEQGKVLLELNNGHIKTKNFDSENIKIGFDISIEDDVLVISKI